MGCAPALDFVVSTGNLVLSVCWELCGQKWSMKADDAIIIPVTCHRVVHVWLILSKLAVSHCANMCCSTCVGSSKRLGSCSSSDIVV